MAILTPDEANAWHRFITNDPTYISIVELESRIQAAYAQMQGGEDRESDFLQMQKEHTEIQKKLYSIGEKWYADLIAKDVKEPAATE